MFPKSICISDGDAGRLARIFQVLRLVSHNAPGVKAIIATDARVAGQMNVWSDRASLTHLNIRVNHRVSADCHVYADSCAGSNYCSRMNGAIHNEKYPSSRSEQ